MRFVLRRERVDEIARRRHLLADVLRIDERRRAADRDALLERPDRQVAVDLRGDARRQGNAVTHERLEAGQREGDRVGARRQLDEVVPALAVRNRRPDFLDERRTRHLDSDTGQNRLRLVACDSRDGRAGARLRPGHARQQKAPHHPEEHSSQASKSHQLASSLVSRGYPNGVAPRIAGPAAAPNVTVRTWLDKSELQAGSADRGLRSNRME